MRWYPKIRLTEVDEQGYYNDGVGKKVYQLQLVVVEKPPEEVVGGYIVSALEERCKDDLLLVVLHRECLADGRLPFHLLLGLQQTPGPPALGSSPRSSPRDLRPSLGQGSGK
jgi:hypothetical protein